MSFPMHRVLIRCWRCLIRDSSWSLLDWTHGQFDRLFYSNGNSRRPTTRNSLTLWHEYYNWFIKNHMDKSLFYHEDHVGKCCCCWRRRLNVVFTADSSITPVINKHWRWIRVIRISHWDHEWNSTSWFRWRIDLIGCCWLILYVCDLLSLCPRFLPWCKLKLMQPLCCPWLSFLQWWWNLCRLHARLLGW